MRVINGDWNRKGIILTVVCDCGELFTQPSWKRWVKCSKCKTQDDLIRMKGEDAKYVYVRTKNELI